MFFQPGLCLFGVERSCLDLLLGQSFLLIRLGLGCPVRVFPRLRLCFLGLLLFEKGQPLRYCPAKSLLRSFEIRVPLVPPSFWEDLGSQSIF